MLALGLVVAVAWVPVARMRTLSVLAAGKSDPSKRDAAIAAAHRYAQLVDNDAADLAAVIQDDTGPISAQIPLAKSGGLFAAALSIASRPTITADERADALETASAIYDDKAHATVALPTELATWAADATAPDRVALAVIALLAKAPRDSNAIALARIINTADLADVRLNAAITALSTSITVGQAGEALNVLTGPNRRAALANDALIKAITSSAGAAHSERLIALLDHAERPVQLFALRALGNGMVLGAAPKETLTKRFTTKLVRTTGDDELVLTILAAGALSLNGTAEQLIALLPAADTLATNGLDLNVLPTILGRTFMNARTPQEQPAAEVLLTKLIKALADERARGGAARALALVENSDLPSFRSALDSLATYAKTSKPCVDALKAMTVRLNNGDLAVKEGGDDGAKWQAFMAKDQPQAARIKAINAWIAEHGNVQRIQDGSAKLQESLTFITAARDEVNGWLQDPKFVAPLGITKAQMETLRQQLNGLFKNVRDGKVGAEQH